MSNTTHSASTLLRMAMDRGVSTVPFLLDTDTYKLSHPQMYENNRSMTAYYTHRGPLLEEDHRIVFYGLRHLYETLLRCRVTMEDIALADAYLAKHSAGGTPFHYPRDLWVKVVEEHDGYLPLTIRALREGETVYPQIPCFITEAKGEFSRLVTWFETRMMRVWNPSTTATKAAMVREHLKPLFEASVEPDEMWRLGYALHDFGSRGVSSTESGMWAGAGHLVVFDGTDNLNAAFKATLWNDGQHVGQSVIASEHSVMTSFDHEEAALEQLIDITPEGAILSCVADSYDYNHFIWNIVPTFVEKLRAKNIFFVVRPDSGDPITCVLDGLAAMEKAFGSTVNAKGFKVITGAGVIQGDGLDLAKITEISDAVHAAGFSAQCVVYGMGGGLLQKQNRDTLRVANKLCEVTREDGSVVPVMKLPKTSRGKFSYPGDMQVNLEGGIPTVYPASASWQDRRVEDDMLEVIWDCGPTDYVWETFDAVRARFARTWDSRPPIAEVISEPLAKKAEAIIAERRS
ncbi:MAG: nicotinamide phosphoribosyltransferase domain-containing protein [Myxococcota bacterium]